MSTRAARVAEWKREFVEDFSSQLRNAPVIGIADITELPAKQFQEIREKLRGRATIRVVKNTLLRLAMARAAQERPEISRLTDFVQGPTAVILTDMDAFKLSRFLKENKTRAPAKPGSKATQDIVIPAGETDLPPGPVVGELQRAGIKARIQAGKVVILEDCKLVKAGDTISAQIADILAKFNILPVELGLKLRAALQNGFVFPAELLEIDEQRVMGELQQAASRALNLAFNLHYPTDLTVPAFIADAAASARALALAARYPVKETVADLLSLARREMLSLASVAGQRNPACLDEELKGLVAQAAPAEAEKKEEKPVEEKPKEEQKEEKGEELSGLGALFG
jgi:large subunit ribosomal protein L10